MSDESWKDAYGPEIITNSTLYAQGYRSAFTHPQTFWPPELGPEDSIDGVECSTCGEVEHQRDNPDDQAHCPCVTPEVGHSGARLAVWCGCPCHRSDD